MLIVKIGGPAYRIGMGGGAASSVASGSNKADLDFNAVQVPYFLCESPLEEVPPKQAPLKLLRDRRMLNLRCECREEMQRWRRSCGVSSEPAWIWAQKIPFSRYTIRVLEATAMW